MRTTYDLWVINQEKIKDFHVEAEQRRLAHEAIGRGRGIAFIQAAQVVRVLVNQVKDARRVHLPVLKGPFSKVIGQGFAPASDNE